MLQVYPDEGLTTLLKTIARNDGNGLLWALFVNDVEPATDNELTDFTLSGLWGQVTLDDTDFVLEQVVANVGTIQGDSIFLENDTGAPVNVYGHVVIDPVTNKLVMVVRFPTAPITVADGAEIPLTPVLGNYSDLSVPVVDGGTF